MDLDYKFEEVRNGFESMLEKYADAVKNPDEYYWHNRIFHGSKFRRAHVEHYMGDPVEVIHVVIIPWTGDPIFGFDLVSIAGNTTLVCGDLTPTIKESDWDHPFENNRELPEWSAEFFSDDVVFMRPDSDGIEVAKWFIDYAEDYIQDFEYVELTDEVIEAQNEYMEHQWKNDKTLRALTADIGRERAEKYMKEVMFPKYEKQS